MSKETKHEQRISKDNCSQKGKIKQLLKIKGNSTSVSIKKMLVKTTSSKFSLVTLAMGENWSALVIFELSSNFSSILPDSGMLELGLLTTSLLCYLVSW